MTALGFACLAFAVGVLLIHISEEIDNFLYRCEKRRIKQKKLLIVNLEKKNGLVWDNFHCEYVGFSPYIDRLTIKELDEI